MMTDKNIDYFLERHGSSSRYQVIDPITKLFVHLDMTLLELAKRIWLLQAGFCRNTAIVIFQN